MKNVGIEPNKKYVFYLYKDNNIVILETGTYADSIIGVWYCEYGAYSMSRDIVKGIDLKNTNFTWGIMIIFKLQWALCDNDTTLPITNQNIPTFSMIKKEILFTKEAEANLKKKELESAAKLLGLSYFYAYIINVEVNA